MNEVKRRAEWTGLVIADAIALQWLRPDWVRLVRDLAAPHRWLDRVGADRAVLSLATAALWCVALWLAVGLGFLAASSLPGPAGAAARRAAARLLPRIMLRAVAGAAGLGVILAPIAPIGAGAKTLGAPLTAGAVPAPGWPTDPNEAPRARVGWPTNPSDAGTNAQPPTATRGPTESRQPTRETNPATPPRDVSTTSRPATRSDPPGARATSRPATRPDPASPRPTSLPATPPDARGAQATSGPAAPRSMPKARRATPTPADGHADRAHRAPSPGDKPVRVRPGDSVWLIAAQRLGANASDAQIAAEWPRWYADNRPVIGPDPSLIQPGQLLRAPAAPDTTR